MKYYKIIFSVCSLLTVCSMPGFSEYYTPVSVDTVKPDRNVDAIELWLKNLTGDSNQANLANPLSDSDVSFLSYYATNPTSPSYDDLNSKQKDLLSQIIFTHADQFSDDLILKFAINLKLQAGANTRQIRDFDDTIQAIQNDKELSKAQIRSVLTLKSIIAKSPGAFTLDLHSLTLYAVAHPRQFSKTDLEDFRVASMKASGLTSDDVVGLKAIASQKTTELTLKQVKTLQFFLDRSGIGAMNALDPMVISRLSEVVEDNRSVLSPVLVDAFKQNLKKHQAVQTYMKNNPNPTPMQTYKDRMNPSQERNTSRNGTPAPGASQRKAA